MGEQVRFLRIMNEEKVKRDFLLNFEDQLEKLTSYYQQELLVLQSKNNKLSEEVLFYKQKVSEKEEKIQELLDKLNNDDQDELVTKLIEIVNTSDVQYHIDLLEQSYKVNDFQDFARCVDNLIEVSSECDQNDVARILAIFEDMFLYEHDDINEMYDCYKASLQLLQKFAESHEAKLFLINNHLLISNCVLDLNDPLMICHLTQTLFVFNLSEILNELLIKVIKQWSFIDANIGKSSFIRLLWLSFIYSLDQKLIEVAKESFRFLKEKDPEILIYTVFQEMVRGKVDLNKGTGRIGELKSKVVLFDKIEQKIIFRILERRIQDLKTQKGKELPIPTSSPEPTQLVDVRKMGHITKLPNGREVLPGTNTSLKEEWIKLATYKDPFFKEGQTFILVRVLSHNKMGKAFVTSKMLIEIKHKIGKKRYFEVLPYGNHQSNQQNKITHTDHFVWPSTEVKGNTLTDVQENSILNEESALKKLGYQITGLTRDKRWSILQKAVSEIGLKKVAFIIAQNVKLRKGQKKGEITFKYSISEWEYDLEKLKKHYYKNDFTWPNTNLTKN